MSWRRVCCFAGVPVVAALLMWLRHGTLNHSTPAVDHVRAAAAQQKAAQRKAMDKFMHASLPFEANLGQTDPEAKFIARGVRYTVFFTPKSVILRLADPQIKGRDNILQMQLVGAQDAEISGQEPLTSRSHYFHGNSPKAWQTDVPHYRKVSYKGVYPDTDLVFYGRQGELEYDVVLGPRVNPHDVVLQFSGATHLSVNKDGDLVLTLRDGHQILQRRPKIYQQAGDHRIEVAGGYRILGTNRVRFEVGGYDRSRPLVIDPVLAYSSYLGGTSIGNDEATSIALDGTGDAYIAGYTDSVGFPTASVPPIQPTLAGGTDAFVAKLSADGSTLLYSTYLGGSSYDQANGIAVDGSGNAYVVGYTSSADFPTTPGSFAPTQQPVGGQSVFVTKLSATGANLVYSTYIGSGSGAAITVDSFGFAYLTGVAYCCSFPTTTGAYQRTSVTSEPFITKLNQNGSALQWSTLFGGNSGSDSGTAIALDSSQNVYVTGSAYSSNFPVTAGAYQTVLAGNSDVFIAKMNSTGSAPIYSTFLGGNSWDYGYGIAVDSMGFAYVTGTTTSTNFPTTVGAYQTGLNGFQAGFAAKLNQTGAGLVYSTFLGSNSNGGAIAIDSSGDAYLTVFGNFPLTPGAYSASACCAYLTKLNPSGNALIYSSQLGFSGYTQTGLAVDGFGNAYIASFTSFPGYPITPGAYQQSLAGENDAVITKLNSSGTALVYSTFLGGEGGDQGLGIAIDTSGSAYVTGSAGSLNFPTTTVTAAKAEQGPYTQVFVTKFNPAGTGLSYSTFVSGSGNDTGRSITVGTGGVVYVTGQTNSSDFPVTVGAPQATIGGGYDAFLFKLSSVGQLTYSTFIGGSSSDDGRSVAVDSLGNAYVAGNTSSPNFFKTSTIGTPSPFNSNVFVAKVNAAGSAYLYSTLLGGSNGQFLSGIAIDSSGSAYITGNTVSSDFPVTAGSYQTIAPSFTSAFVTKLNPAGSGLSYSTYLGGTNNTTYGNAIAVDATLSAYVTGYTNSTTFPVSTGSFQPTLGGSQNAFVTKLNPAGSALSYSTYLGGSVQDQANAIAVDGSGNVYVAGTTTSLNFPTATGGMEVVFPGLFSFPGSGFVTSLNTTGTSLNYSTFLGTGVVNGISAKAGYAIVAGTTSTPDLIGATTGYQKNLAAGAQNAFVSKVSYPPAGCTYSASPTSFSLGSNGGSGTVNVNAGAGCPWMAVNPDSSRVSLSSPPMGSGNGSVTFNISPDTFTNDSGSVSLFTVAGRLITVTQTAPCAISLPSNGITIGPGAFSSGDLLVNGGSCYWNTYTTTPWISSPGNNSYGNGVVPYSVQPNLKAASRTGFIYVGPQTFTITQLGSPATVATMVSPVPETVLPGPTVTFDWTAISGADQYLLDVGTSLGQGNICAATVTTNQSTCSNVPTGGGTIYVQLSTHISGSWESPVQYTYSAAANSVATLLSPAPATPYPGPPTTVLPGTHATFTWSTGIGADQYLLQVGTALNQSDVCTTTTTSTLFTCTNLPCNGSTIYAQISTHFASGWQLPNQYVYLACTATLGIITSPTPLSTLSGSSVTFKWAGGVGADDYQLEVGTSPRQGNICTTTTTVTQSTCSNIPTNGSPIYVLLRTHVNGAWQTPNLYTYTAALLNQYAQITSPVNNSVFPGSSVTFQWTSVSGATAYGLEVGSALGQADICKVSIAAPTTQYTCNNIPTDGRIIYVRLYTFETSWREPNYYTFTAF